MLHTRGIVLYHPDNATDERGTVICVPELPLIGSRWAPKPVLRRDTETGTFEHVNPRDFSNDALYLQQALLYAPRPSTFSWAAILVWGGGVLGVWALVAWFIVTYGGSQT